jgi:hypothetical protein
MVPGVLVIGFEASMSHGSSPFSVGQSRSPNMKDPGSRLCATSGKCFSTISLSPLLLEFHPHLH